MNLKERVLASFRYEEVKPVPQTIWYDHDTMEKLNLYYGSSDWQDRIQNYILRVIINWEPRNYLDETRFTDIYGSLWQEGNPVHLVDPALKKPSLKGFEIPDLTPYVYNSKSEDPGLHSILPCLSYDDARQLIETEGDRVFTVVGYGYGLFDSSWIVRGLENFYSDLMLEPKFTSDLLDLLVERHLELLDVLVRLPCDGIREV